MAHFLYVRDRFDIPAARQYTLRLMCCEAHPGVCATRDAPIYLQALKLAGSLMTLFTKDMLHTFFRVEEPGARHPMLPIFMFVRLRRRNVRAQCTHAFIRCVEHSDKLISLGQHGLHHYDFYTAWSLARELLRAEWRAVRVVLLGVEDGGEHSCMRVTGDARSFEVWPHVFRHPRRPRAPGPPIDDLVPRPRRARTGGVKYISPLAVASVGGGADGGDAGGGDRDNDGAGPVSADVGLAGADGERAAGIADCDGAGPGGAGGELDAVSDDDSEACELD